MSESRAFRLGLVERWVIGVIGTAAVGIAWWLVASMQLVLTQQAVINQQLLTISGQLADVPSLSRGQAEHEVRISRLESDFRELRGGIR